MERASQWLTIFWSRMRGILRQGYVLFFKFSHLLIEKTGPEANFGSFIGIIRQQPGSILPGFIDIFKNDERLNDGFSIVNKDRNLLVNRIVLEDQLALVAQIFFNILIGYALKFEGQLYPLSESATPHSM